MILSLPAGQEAVLRERLTYGQAHGVRVAYFAIEANPAAKADLDLALVRAYVSAWTVLDLDGRAVSLDTPELAPDDVIQAIVIKAADLFGLTRVPVEVEPELPKDGNGSSPITLPEVRLMSETIR
jgi:hypothetical protein